MRKSSRSTSSRRSERGSALIEMAVVLPMLMVIFGGLAAFSSVSQTYLAMVQSARSGAISGGAVSKIQERSQLVWHSYSLNSEVIDFAVTPVADPVTNLVTVRVSSTPKAGVLGMFGGVTLSTQETGATL